MPLLVFVLVLSGITPSDAGAIVGGTDRVDDSVTASAAFIEILTTNGSETCSGT